MLTKVQPFSISSETQWHEGFAQNGEASRDTAGWTKLNLFWKYFEMSPLRYAPVDMEENKKRGESLLRVFYL